jgi:hypothetical protein
MTRAVRHERRRADGWRGSKAGHAKGPWGDVPARIVHLRGWPGTDDYRPPRSRSGYASRPVERPALVFFAAADAAAEGDTFGLLAAEERIGPLRLRRWLVVPDDLAGRDPVALGRITAWATEHTTQTVAGRAGWEVLTSSEFFEPFAGPFGRVAYSSAGFVVGADLLRPFGLVAEHVVPRRGEGTGSFELWLPGWGTVGPKGNVRRRTPHCPALRARPRRVGAQVSWGPVERGNGKTPRDLARGGFLDVLTAAYALDADRGASFAEHAQRFGCTPVELPLAVDLDAAGCEVVTDALTAIAEFALVLDEYAARWYTDARERSEGRARVDLSRMASPNAIAAELLARFRIEAPLSKFTLSDEEYARWAEGLHGGWCAADRRLLGRPFPGLVLDVTSAFAAAAHLLDWWELLTAAELRHEDVTAELRDLCRRAAKDPAVLFDPAVWRRFGCTLVTSRPWGGVPFPVEVRDRHRPDGRLEVVPVQSSIPLHVPWCDVVAGAVLSGKVPRIVKATRLVPVARQTGCRQRIPSWPGIVLDLDDDIAVTLALLRQAVKAEDPTLGALLRVVVNSLVFGGLARFDPIWRTDGRRQVPAERPGPWCFLPIAVSVTAAARLFLAVLDRLVRDRGGIVAYRDTDSATIPAHPGGGTLGLGDGSSIRQLTWAEVDALAAFFDALAPFGPRVPFWKTTRGTPEHPLHAVVFGEKKHAEFVFGPAGPEVVTRRDGDPDPDDLTVIERTETALGGFYRDPPAMRDRAPDGRRRWSLAAVEREVRFALDRQRDTEAVRPPAPWDVDGEEPAPAVRHLQVRSAAKLDSLHPSIGARIGSYVVEAVADPFRRSADVPVALGRGPGRELAWRDRATGARLTVTTDPRRAAEHGAVLLASLDSRAVDWARPPRGAVIAEVAIDERLVVRVGRVSGVIDAWLYGEPGDPANQRPRYRSESLPAALRRANAVLRQCEAPGCTEPLLGRIDERYCTEACKKVAKRARLARAQTPDVAPAPAPVPSAVDGTEDTEVAAADIAATLSTLRGLDPGAEGRLRRSRRLMAALRSYVSTGLAPGALVAAVEREGTFDGARSPEAVLVARVVRAVEDLLGEATVSTKSWREQATNVGRRFAWDVAAGTFDARDVYSRVDAYYDEQPELLDLASAAYRCELEKIATEKGLPALLGLRERPAPEPTMTLAELVVTRPELSDRATR